MIEQTNSHTLVLSDSNSVSGVTTPSKCKSETNSSNNLMGNTNEIKLNITNDKRKKRNSKYKYDKIESNEYSSDLNEHIYLDSNSDNENNKSNGLRRRSSSLIEMMDMEDSKKNKNNVKSPKTAKKKLSTYGKIKKFLTCSAFSDDNSERILTYNGKSLNDIKILPNKKFSNNSINNQKYTIISFLPLFLYGQFNQFWNLYFLAVCASQLPMFEYLQVGYWWTYWAPLAFVILISLIRELYDDIKRYFRDRSVNNQIYKKLFNNSIVNVRSADIKVGDLIVLEENNRVPADMVLLYCNDSKGTTFIRTDQLDGETDWKLRRPISCIQNKYKNLTDVCNIDCSIQVESPHCDIYEFLGSYKDFATKKTESLNLENTLWSSTVVASGINVGCVIYTGNDTKSMLNNTESPLKLGRLDIELNFYAKILFFMMIGISSILAFVKGDITSSTTWLYFFRFILLLSTIIPISLRVFMDMSKIWFSITISRDELIEGTNVRTTTIPEELGRISYLFTDKTGTLTKNEMKFKKLQLQPPLCYDSNNIEIISQHVVKGFKNKDNNCTESISNKIASSDYSYTNSNRRNANVKLQHYSNEFKSTTEQVTTFLEAIAICHNVTPIINKSNNKIDYQASSPDEVALVKFTESCGLTLYERDKDNITLKLTNDKYYHYKILNIFPFTSESKRMGIIIKDNLTDNIIFYSKGAESIMKLKIDLSNNEWLDEEVENLAREGLRTLVFAKKILSQEEYNNFINKYHLASLSISKNRKIQMENIKEKYLEIDMSLLGITGVEDKLQDNVQYTLETLRNANINIWMLTGDKIETAQVIARSSKLVSYGQKMFTLVINNKYEAQSKLDLFGSELNNYDVALVIDGKSLDIYLQYFEKQFIELAVETNVVICCRCSPTQKSDMVEKIKLYTNKICCSIGDGGNDVPMIQCANIGIGIVGKEGQQAALAADYSINKFEYITRLFLWHGRIAYKNNSKISLFVIHRGLIIAIMQTFFSIFYYFSAIPIFTGLLAVGYATVYTSLPVFSLVLDYDISYNIILYFPELYKKLQYGYLLHHKIFLIWILKSFYQGGIILICSLIYFNSKFHNIISITFTSLLLSELFNVAFEIKNWNRYILLSEIISVLVFLSSIYFLKDKYFDLNFIITMEFFEATMVTSLVSCLPVFLFKYIYKKCNPSAHTKLKDQKHMLINQLQPIVNINKHRNSESKEDIRL